ncbi:secretion protein EspA [Aeromonas schubertii]|uniref:secretion protein EspA n=1 Tax=Aeromonas schubertii TaxID=652 RepID=UPI001CC4FA09|nr:secretion protein EspA [Aeromonas schubertii]MBZ6071288.1 secretion protein EspA [Aeromonas schubertii]
MSIATHFSSTAAVAASPDYDAYVDRKAGEGDNLMSEGISVLYKFMTLFSDLAQVRYNQMSAKADRARDSQQAANQVDAILSKLAKADDKAALPPDVVQYLRDHHIAITVQNDGKNSTSDIDGWLRAQVERTRPDDYIPGCRASDAFDLPDWAERASPDELRNLPFVRDKWQGTVWRQALSYIYDREMANPGQVKLDKGQLDMIKGALETDSGRCSDFVTQAQLQIQKTMQSYNVCVSLVNSMQTLLAEMNKSIAQNIR